MGTLVLETKKVQAPVFRLVQSADSSSLELLGEKPHGLFSLLRTEGKKKKIVDITAPNPHPPSPPSLCLGLPTTASKMGRGYVTYHVLGSMRGTKNSVL